MSHPLSLVLDDRTYSSLENAAGRAGQSPADFLADQLAIALGVDRAAREAIEPRKRPSRPSSRRNNPRPKDIARSHA